MNVLEQTKIRLARQNFQMLNAEIAQDQFFHYKFKSLSQCQKWIDLLLAARFSGPKTSNIIHEHMPDYNDDSFRLGDAANPFEVSDLLCAALKEVEDFECKCVFCGKIFRYGDAYEHYISTSSSTSKVISRGLTGGSVTRQITTTTVKHKLHACPECHKKVIKSKRKHKAIKICSWLCLIIAIGVFLYIALM